MARLYVDENLASLVGPLREARHDVVSAGDVGQGRTDPWHIREALRDRRVILTLDKSDFVYLHKFWTTLRIMSVVGDSHPGIVTAAQAPGFTHFGWLPVLLQKLQSPGDLEGRLFRWVAELKEWREDAWRPED